MRYLPKTFARRAFATAFLLALLWPAGPAAAERVRYRYVPAPDSRDVVLQSAGGPGERVSRFGGSLGTSSRVMRPTHLVTFRHPCTGREVAVPMKLPDSTPQIQHVRDSIVFNYGSYAIEVHFFRGGSVNVIYDSGPFRPL